MELNKPLLCEIERIVDGDTFVCKSLKTGYVFKVRMNEIDAPEISQPAGWEAHFHLKELLKETDYKVYITPKLLGKNNRVVADVHQSMSTALNYDVQSSLNYRMVDDGQAWSYTTSNEVSGLIKNAEVLAHGNEKGLWNRVKTDPVHPAIWRKNKMKMNSLAANAERVRKADYCLKHNISSRELMSGKDFFNIKKEKEAKKTIGLKLNDEKIKDFLNSRTGFLSKFATEEEIKEKDRLLKEKIEESIIPEKMNSFLEKRKRLLSKIKTSSDIEEENIRKQLSNTSPADNTAFNDIDDFDFDTDGEYPDFDDINFDDMDLEHTQNDVLFNQSPDDFEGGMNDFLDIDDEQPPQYQENNYEDPSEFNSSYDEMPPQDFDGGVGYDNNEMMPQISDEELAYYENEMPPQTDYDDMHFDFDPNEDFSPNDSFKTMPSDTKVVRISKSNKRRQ